MKKEILERGYVTHALTNSKDKIYGRSVDEYINDWSCEGAPFYWSEVYCEGGGYFTKIIRKGQLLINQTNEELSQKLEQSKVNLH